MRLRACMFALAAVAFGQVPHQNHPPSSATEYAKVLEDPSRDEWQKPHDVVWRLALKSTETIAEYWSGNRLFRAALRPPCRQGFTQSISRQAARHRPQRRPGELEAGPGRSDDHASERSIDTIFFCDVLHHIENRPAYTPGSPRC